MWKGGFAISLWLEHLPSSNSSNTVVVDSSQDRDLADKIIEVKGQSRYEDQPKRLRLSQIHRGIIPIDIRKVLDRLTKQRNRRFDL